jgi:hypothetical protein
MLAPVSLEVIAVVLLEISSLWRCDAVSLGEWVQTVERIVKLSSVVNTLSQTSEVFIGTQICTECRKVRSIIAGFLCWRSKHTPSRL